MKKAYFNKKYGLQQAVLEGRKTVTRRVDKRLNDPRITHISEWGIDEKGKAYIALTYIDDSTKVIYPAYQIGEEMAVAQSYSNLREVLAKRDFKRTDALYDKFYRAMQMGETHDGMPGWGNKMFVRPDLMPHCIRITDIKCERLQDISDEDCLKEGVKKHGKGTFKVDGIRYVLTKRPRIFYTPKQAFECLIDKICGKGTWDRNPWVFAYKFELIK